MWILKKSFKVSYAHRVFTQDLSMYNLKSKCLNWHGHDSIIEWIVEGDLQDNGMVIDYNVLKKSVSESKGITHPEMIDHTLLLSRKDPMFDQILNLYDKVSIVLDDSRLNGTVYNGLFIHNFVTTAELMAQFFTEQLYNLIIALGLKNIHMVSCNFKETQDTDCIYKKLI
jgi:6-pyruvoyl-tetrahydropterin synthase